MTLPAVLAILLAAAPVAADPAGWLSDEFPVYVEIREPSRLLGTLRHGLVFLDLEPLLPSEVVRIVETAAGLGVTRAAAGIAPALRAGGVAFAVLLEAPDRTSLRTTLESLLTRAGLLTRARRVTEAGPFVIVVDGVTTLETIRPPGEGDTGTLAGREDFKTFRERIAGGDVRFHADIDLLLPLRPVMKPPSDAGAVILGAHLAAAAAGARHVSGSLDLGGGLRLHIESPSQDLPDELAFAMPRGARERLVPPDGFVGRISFARDFGAFWRHREKLLPASARGGFAEFQNNAGLLLGGLAIEDLFAGLDTGFDLHFAALPPLDPAPRHRFPAGALIIGARTEKLRGEIPLAFQQVISFVNADSTQKGRPRFFLENRTHRGITVLTARYPRGSLAEPGDDRVQLEPTLAIVGERVIAGSHPSIVLSLVDRALDGRTETREDGDAIRVDGPGALRILQENAEALAAAVVMERGRKLDAAREDVKTLLRWAGCVRGLALGLRVRDGSAAFDLDLDAPGLVTGQEAGKGR